MLSLLVLGLLVAGLCPTVHGLPGGFRDQENATQEDLHKDMPADSFRLASGNTDFAFSLYKQLVLKNPNKNVVFSPLSISMALAFLSLGARGTTLTEILSGLRLNLTETSETEVHQGFRHLLRALSQPSGPLQLSMGNAMFIDEKLQLLDKFKDDAEQLYASEAFSTNFNDSATAEKFINDYVKEKTQGKIVDLVKNLDADTMMVLVNYLFFKAKWMTPFHPGDTFQSKFYVNKRRWVQVPMMSNNDLTTPYFRDKKLSCTVVELRYTGNSSALLILPDKGKMSKVEATLLPETLRRWRDSLQMRWIELFLPKFSIGSDYDLEHILPALGIREVFTKDSDLSGVTGAKNVAVSQVVHKTLIDVAETGTEAAAATGVRFVPMSLKIPMATVEFNRPFLLLILSKDTDSILFGAKVVNPSEA